MGGCGATTPSSQMNPKLNFDGNSEPFAMVSFQGISSRGGSNCHGWASSIVLQNNDKSRADLAKGPKTPIILKDMSDVGRSEKKSQDNLTHPFHHATLNAS